jgi:hypothetical protein
MPELALRPCGGCGDPTLFAVDNGSARTHCRQCVADDPLLAVSDRRVVNAE